MSVRMSATFQYVDQVGCSFSIPSAVWSTLAWCSCALSCAMVSGLLDEVHEREDRDPDDVDEVPVQGSEVDVDRVLRLQSTPVVDGEERQQPEHASRDVRAVEAGEREERAAEQIGADRQSLVDERGELERLEAEEGGAEDGGH